MLRDRDTLNRRHLDYYVNQPVPISTDPNVSDSGQYKEIASRFSKEELQKKLSPEFLQYLYGAANEFSIANLDKKLTLDEIWEKLSVEAQDFSFQMAVGDWQSGYDHGYLEMAARLIPDGDVDQIKRELIEWELLEQHLVAWLAQEWISLFEKEITQALQTPFQQRTIEQLDLVSTTQCTSIEEFMTVLRELVENEQKDKSLQLQLMAISGGLLKHHALQIILNSPTLRYRLTQEFNRFVNTKFDDDEIQ